MRFFHSLLFIGLLAFCNCTSQEIIAQNDDFKWRIGFAIGVMDYQGDLSEDANILARANRHYRNTNEQKRPLSYELSIEKRITDGLSFLLHYTRGQVSANDRSNIDNTYFTRSLNFKSKLNDLSGNFQFRLDNDRILPYNFPIAPYFYIGAGFSRFRVYGDLKDEKGEFYDYIGLGQDVVQDGEFETELTQLNADDPIGHGNTAVHINGGFGLRLRIGNRISIHAQTDIKQLFSDYLDDVGNENFRNAYDDQTQEFAGRPNAVYLGPRAKTNGRYDSYMQSTIGLRFSFGRKDEGFKAPIFYAPSDRKSKLIVPEATPSISTEPAKPEIEKGKSKNKDKKNKAANAKSKSKTINSKKAYREEIARLKAELEALKTNPAQQSTKSNANANTNESEALLEMIQKLNDRLEGLEKKIDGLD